MAEIEKKEFVWRSYSDTMPFPLDYSMADLKKLWKVNREDITAYTADSPLFQYFYLWMRYTKGVGVEKEEYTRKGIPSELEPFFHIYFDEVRKAPWHIYVDKNKYPLRIDGENLLKFEQFLCEKLHNMAAKKEAERYVLKKKIEQEKSAEKQEPFLQASEEKVLAEKPDDLYWYRRLYENQAFQKAVSLSYWEKEYNYRCDLLRELSVQLPHEVQIQQLQKAIINMDTQIAAMLHIIEREKASNAQQRKQGGFLETYPIELIDKLRTRVDDCDAENVRVGYHMKNFEISTVICDIPKTEKLEKYFENIKSFNKAKATQEAIRPYYLHNVCKVPEKSKFQVVCEALQIYLDFYANINMKDEELRDYVVLRCKMYYQNFFGFMGAYTGALQPGVDPSAGIYLVIEELISSIYTTFYFQHINVITFVSMCNRDLQNQINLRRKQVAENIDAGFSVEHVNKKYFEWYSSMVKSLCSGYLVKEPKILDKELSQEEINEISHEMEIGCKDAYEAFGGSAYDWMNKTYFKKLWNRYNALYSTFDNTIDPAGTCEEDIQLCTALLMYRVWKECIATVNATLGSFNALKKHLIQRKGGSHNATHQEGNVKQEGSK